MELTRCRICGEVYFGSSPSHCPYCGAHKKYLVPLGKWKDENRGVVPGEKEKENLKTTQALEYENTRFYRAAAGEAESPEIAGFFKYLARIENEHYNVASKLLGAEKDPAIFKPSDSKGNDLANLKYSKEKEEHAAKLYAGFIPQSENERIKTFFEALAEVESDHIVLDDSEIDKLT